MIARQIATSLLSTVVLLIQAIASHAANEYEDLNKVQIKIEQLSTGKNTGEAPYTLLLGADGKKIKTEGKPGPHEIYLLKVSKSGGTNARKNILVIGTQHAREWVAYRCVLDLAELIIQQRNNVGWPNGGARFGELKKFAELDMSKLTDNANIYFVPIANPAGYDFSRSPNNDQWRKNRRDTAKDDQLPPGRFTGFDNILPGVDINRNWSTSDWGDDTTRAFPPPNGPVEQIRTSRYKDQEIYCGKPKGNMWANNPFRPPIVEKEIEGLVELSKNVAFDCVIDVHSFSALVGWSENADAAAVHLRPNQGWQNDLDIMRAFASKAGGLMVNPDDQLPYDPTTGPYPASGDSLWYFYEQTNKKAFTYLIEVGKNGFHPANATAHAQAVQPGMLFMMFATIDKSFASKPQATLRKPDPGELPAQ